MNATALGLSACFTYCIALTIHCMRLRRFSTSRTLLKCITVCGVLLHGAALYAWIESPLGQPLSLSHLFSMVCWIMAFVSVVLCFFQSMLNLTLFIVPLACLSIALVLLFPGQEIVLTHYSPSTLIHIVISIAAFSLLGMAALQATVLYLQNRLLRNKSSMGIVRLLPPLQTTEALLFSIVWFGFFFLSASLTSAFLLLKEAFSLHLHHKIILSTLAWLLFAVLLYNHHQSGLRGLRAIRWTFIGVGLLIVAYLGGKVVPKEFLN